LEARIANENEDARIAELKRHDVDVFHKNMHDASGWWWRRGSGYLNRPFQSTAGACKKAFATIRDDA